MANKIKVVAVIVAVGVVAAIAALMWPRPCTPDEECVDYVNQPAQ